jgi:hypothetical protein
MIISALIIFLIRNFTHKFSEPLKKRILCSVTFSEIGKMIRNSVQYCTVKQAADRNLTRRMVIAY